MLFPMQDNITTLLELTNKGFKIKEKKKRKKRHISDIGKKQKKKSNTVHSYMWCKSFESLQADFFSCDGTN